MGVSSTLVNEIHPPQAGYRLSRWMRRLQRFRGWRRLAAVLAPPNKTGAYRVWNNGIGFEGNISSYIDREIYLFGGYEEETIDLFLSLVPLHRRRTILDIGANIGTHTLAFSQHFEKVHSFEPNAGLWAQFERNLVLNKRRNVFLHKVGLGMVSADQPFFSINKNNFGLGTFSTVEQYDLPLQQIGVFRLEKGDECVEFLNIENIDAIKIDVQGLEPDVLSGLNNTLRKFQPIVWFEFGTGTRAIKLGGPAEMKPLFPYPISMWRIVSKHSLISHQIRLEAVADEEELAEGDFIAVPRNYNSPA